MTCKQPSWDRTYSVNQYLRQQGIDSFRFVYTYAQDGHSPLVVTIRSLEEGEDGPASIEAGIPGNSYQRVTRKRCSGPY